MKKMIVLLIGVLSIMIFTFYSCKQNHSKTSATVEKKGDNCFLTYTKTKLDTSEGVRNYVPSHYCVTQCEICPERTDVDRYNTDFNPNDELLTKLCPLKEDNTVYIKQITDLRTEYIDPNVSGEIEYRELEEGQKPLKFRVQDISQDNVLEKCSRMESSSYTAKESKSSSKPSGSVVAVNSESSQKKKSIPEEYKIGICSYGLVIGHTTDGNNIDAIWKVDVLNPYKEENYFINLSIPPGYRLPKESECNKRLVTALNWLISRRMSGYENPVNDGEGLDRFWLAEKDQQDEGRQHTCMYNGSISSSRTDLGFAHLVLAQESDIESQSKQCIFVSYYMIKALNFFVNSIMNK